MVDDLSTEIAELAAQLQQLKHEVRRHGVRATSSRLVRPAALEKVLASSWVNPHQPIAWPHWPKGVWPKLRALLQKMTRRLLRWYIDPLVEEQNALNSAVAQNLEMLYQEVVALRFQLELTSQALPAVDRPQHVQVPLPEPRPADPDSVAHHRLRLAFFTPLSPLKTAIADHSEGLLPHMARHADIDLYIDDGYQPDNPTITEHFDIYNHRRFPDRADNYDACLYAMGDNASFHTYIYDALQRFPGIVILHDTTLHRFTIGRTLQWGDIAGYLEEIDYAYGLRDLRIAEQVSAGYGQILIARYPLIERVVDLAQGVIVHNDYARQQVLKRRPAACVTCIGQHFSLPPGFPAQVDPAALRAEMNLVGRFVIASYGIFVPDKRLDSCLGAFATFAKSHPEAIYLFVGNYQDYDLPGKARELGVKDRVIVTGWLDPVRFTELMLVADVGVHLRYPHIGGTPFSPVRMLGLGVPTIVSDIEPLAGFPEGCCVKVPPDEYEEETLLACFELLVDEPGFRRRLGEAARQFVATRHDAGQIARQYLAFVEERARLGAES
jgi:glycosyltransferase involved in cell wall biosynthesis